MLSTSEQIPHGVLWCSKDRSWDLKPTWANANLSWDAVDLLLTRILNLQHQYRLHYRLVWDQMWAHLNHEVKSAGNSRRDVLLLFVRFQTPLIPTVRSKRIWWGNFMRIIKEPLQEFHIKLELSICHLLYLYSLIDFKLCEHIIQNFQIPSIVILVSCIEIQFMKRHACLGMNGVDNLAICDRVTAKLHFWIICLTKFVDPGQQLQPA